MAVYYGQHVQHMQLQIKKPSSKLQIDCEETRVYLQDARHKNCFKFLKQMNNNKLDEKQISYRNISLYKKLCSLSLAYIVKSAPF